LNAYRDWLSSGGRLNSNFDDSANYTYDVYVEADFESGGMENSDGVTKDKALLREIIEERYISGFGSFVLRDKKERIGRNPKTGVEVPITPRRVMTFRASQLLKERIANG
jgi:hypothetical protein